MSNVDVPQHYGRVHSFYIQKWILRKISPTKGECP